MKILHVTEAYGGGIYTVINQLIRAQIADGHEVVFSVNVRAETPANWRQQLPPQVRVTGLVLQRAISPLRDAAGVAQIAALILRERPDVIHLHSSKAGFAGRLAAKLTGCIDRVLYAPHAFAFLDPKLSANKRELYRKLESAAAQFGGLVVACSTDELEQAQALGLRATVINNSIEQSELAQLVSQIARQESPVIRVYSSGRVCAAKRPELFVAVAEKLREKGLPVSFTWIGGGEAFPQTNAAQCLGWLPREDALRTLAEQADIYLQTSAYEGLPLSVLEAQALGLPVVVADAVGNRSAVAQGHSGYVTAPHVEDLALAIERLVLDRDLRLRIGQQAKAWAQQEFDTPLMLERYADLYKRTINKK